MKPLSLGYSPCPNDTFIFYAMTHEKAGDVDLKFREILLDVETLNQKALHSELDLTKISYHAFGHLRKEYCMLRAGGAIGKGCGPLLVSKKDYSVTELRDKRIAIPGRLTTANLLLQLHDPHFISHPASFLYVMPFNKILAAVASEEVDAGLIIHESRFTYPSYGLRKIIDLGEWWEDETGLPIPLGGIIAKRSLGENLHKRISSIIKSSIEYALIHPSEPMDYIKKHSQELSDDVIKQHIDLYVNKYSLDIGDDGERAVKEFLLRAEETGIIPKSKEPLFI
ncbi:MAG: 1,4-dihydroxy-6-naphthoate synthase [Nitrospirae bacterium]|nr:1,4-dihydroxy-6-naphthoate synthase [Nitrospirota bacterium]